MLCFCCMQTHMKLQSEFSREFLKTIFARLPPLASAARCGPHPPHSLLATPLTLPERTSNLVDCNFIIRMLYLNPYWLNIGLRYKYVIFTVCHSYISHCVSKCVMSFCQLNDYWLTDWLNRQTDEGLTEIAGLDIDGRVKKRGWTLQDWTMADRTLTDGYLYHQKSNNKVYESFAHIEFNAK